MSARRSELAILGAGPTGLGAAWRLAELGHRDWVVLEAADGPGGLSASFGDARGFVWDVGVHVLHSHYAYFDRVMDDVLGPDGWIEHERQAWIWMRNRFVPYPLQHNLHRLPAGDLERCLAGLVAADARPARAIRTFADWLLATFGAGIADVFLFPYNAKAWGYAPETLSATWVGDRVATIDVARVLENVARRRDDVGWGPNSRFRFPARGGTGEIWNACARLLPRERVHYRRAVVAIDLERRIVTTAAGDTVRWDQLVSTLPLTELLRLAGFHEQAATVDLLHTTTHVVALGLTGTVPERLTDKSWIYFPEDDCPFHRVTVFSNFSRGTVPTDGAHWSLIAEVTESRDRPLVERDLPAAVITGLLGTGMIDRREDVVAARHLRVPYGYPVPALGRDAELARVLPELERRGVYSRGRFGLWKYEVSNQDHAFMQGVEVVERLVNGHPEITAADPSHANAGKHAWPFARWTARDERVRASGRT